MASKRNYVTEILAIKGRSTDSYSIAFNKKMGRLHHAFEQSIPSDSELLKYFPIGLVACLEGLCKGVVKTLINHGSPYFENAEKLKSVKLDFNILTALQHKEITVGELYSHLLSFSNLGHIESHIGCLLNGNSKFLVELEKVTNGWKTFGTDKTPEPIIKDPEQVLKDIRWLFEMRHIYAHEMALSKDVEPDVTIIERCFKSIEVFAEAMNELIGNYLFPDAPQTQGEMNQYAYGEYEKERTNLETTYEELEKELSAIFEDDNSSHRDTEYIEKLRESQKTWETFLNLESEFHADLVAKGGSMWSMQWAMVAKDLTFEREAQLSQAIHLLKYG